MLSSFVVALGNKGLFFVTLVVLALGSNTSLWNSGRTSHYGTGDPGSIPGPDNGNVSQRHSFIS